MSPTPYPVYHHPGPTFYFEVHFGNKYRPLPPSAKFKFPRICVKFARMSSQGLQHRPPTLPPSAKFKFLASAKFKFQRFHSHEVNGKAPGGFLPTQKDMKSHTNFSGHAPKSTSKTLQTPIWLLLLLCSGLLPRLIVLILE